MDEDDREEEKTVKWSDGSSSEEGNGATSVG